MLGVPELLVILAIVLLLFGARRITKVAGEFGASIREFKNAARDDDPASKQPKS